MNGETEFSVMMGLALASGLLAFGHGALMSMLRGRFWRQADEAIGQILGYRVEDMKYERGKTISRMIGFEMPDGRYIAFCSTLGAIPYFYRQGQEVAVIYDPEAPYEAHIKNWFWMCCAPVFESIAGLIVVLWAGLTLASGS